jgi:glycosyltransferase involved in cell wall biosynthesis
VHVALDARVLQDPAPGGVGRGLANIVEELARHVDLELLTDARRPPAASTVRQHALRAPLSGRGVAWLQFAAPAWLRGFDGLFHCPFYGLPYRQPVPMVVTIHDTSFEDHPEWFSWRQRTVFRAQARHAARTAQRILTPSVLARDEVCDRYRVSADRVLVAPNAVDPAFGTDHDVERQARLIESLALSRPYVVALGGAPRRGLATALAAFEIVRRDRPDLSLVVVGGPATAGDGVVASGHLVDADWAALLAGAEALCYPTSYEGFGMPALEAAASGTPVVCARVGALPEVLGGAASWSDGLAPEAIAEALLSVVNDQEYARQLRQAGLARAAEWPRWDQAAEVVLRAYQEVADG